MKTFAQISLSFLLLLIGGFSPVFALNQDVMVSSASPSVPERKILFDRIREWQNTLSVTHAFPQYYWRSVQCDSNNTQICTGTRYDGAVVSEAEFPSNTDPASRMVEGRETASTPYKYDPTAPVCWGVELFDASRNPISLDTLETWTNKVEFVRAKCDDGSLGSGCKAANSAFVGATNRMESVTYPTAFEDVAGNVSSTNTCLFPGKTFRTETRRMPGWTYTVQIPVAYKRLLLDQALPNIKQVKIDGAIPASGYTAGARSISFVVDDTATDNYGVSGIASVKTEVTRIKNTYSETVSPVKVCENSQVFDSYNSDGTKDAPDEKTISVSCSDTSGMQVAGVYAMKITVLDAANNERTREWQFRVVPAGVDGTKFNFTKSGGGYANTTDEIAYSWRLADWYNNPIHSMPIRSLEQSGGMGLYLDEVSKTGERAFIYKNVSSVTDRDGQVRLKLSSYAPGKFTDSFAFQLATWDTNYAPTSSTSAVQVPGHTASESQFLRLHTGEFTIENGNLQPGTTQKVTLSVLNRPGAPGGAVSHLDSLAPNGGGLQFTAQSRLWEREINLTSVQTGPITTTGFWGSPYLSFSLGWKSIRTYLASTDSDFGTPPKVIFSGANTNNIYVQGQTQSQGNGALVWADKEVNGTVASASQSDAVRKKLFEAIRGMNPGTIVNGIRLVRGDVDISGSIDGYETLVVIDGDIRITGNLNIAGKKLGIAAIRDSDSSKWNILIESGVAYVGTTAVYADGSIWSSNGGTVLAESNATRTNALQKQLVLKGAFFTKNTIGGATGGTGQYALPRGETTSSLNEAVKYDLSFLRMNHVGYDDSSWTRNYNAGRTESVIFLQATDALSSPPKGFY